MLHGYSREIRSFAMLSAVQASYRGISKQCEILFINMILWLSQLGKLHAQLTAFPMLLSGRGGACAQASQ